MNFKKFLFIGLLLVVLSTIPVSFAADINITDINPETTDFNDSDMNLISYDLDNSIYDSIYDSNHDFNSNLDVNLSSNLNSINYTYVNGSYTGDEEYGTITNPFKTINKAVDYILNDSSSIGNLYIANGDYTINSYMNITKNMNIVGESSEVSVNCNKTILFAFTQCFANIINLRVYNGYSDSNYSVIYGSGANIVLNNMIFTNNYAESPGGIFVIENEGNLTLNNCSIINNCINYSTGISGGIIYSTNSNLTINNSLFDNNTVLSLIYQGGFIYFEYGDFNLINSKISNVFINATSVNGGIIYNKGKLNLINSSISNVSINSSKVYGAFIYFYTSTILDKIILANSSFSGGHFKDICGLLYSFAPVLFDNVTLFNNYAECIEGNLTFYDVYNLSLTKGLKTYNNTFDEIGYNPIEVANINYMDDAFTSAEIEVADLPSSYDLRDYGLVTSVKNQESSGTCWAFATYGALESYLLKYWNESFDLSENNMKNIMSNLAVNGSERDPNAGGNDLVSLAYLLRWSGAILESDDPFDPTSTEPIYGLDVVNHVQGVLYIPLRMNATDNNQIKYAIMKYGGVFTMTNAYTDITYTESGIKEPNHAVVIVGWDDNYSASNFPYYVPGDGAFIVKNSWGSSWKEEGYCYVSYYAPSFAGLGYSNSYSGFVFTDVENVTNYDYIYQYDIYGNNQYALGFSSNEGWFANEFTANNKELLSAFGFYAYGASNYLAQIYVNGNLVHTQEGSVTGTYNTVNLTKVVGLNKGDLFRIVIKIITPNTLYPIAIEDYSSSFNATANPGESYISRDGVNWEDLTDYYPNANVCLKAYTKAYEPINVSISATQTGKYYKSNYITVKLNESLTGVKLVLKFNDGKTTSTVNLVTSNGVATYNIPFKVGTYKVDVMLNDDFYIGNTTSTVKIYKAKATISASSISTTYKSGKTLNIKVLGSDKRPMVGVTLKLKVYTGNKYKTVSVKTDSNGIAKYDGSSLSIGKHKVIINSGESTSYMTASAKTVYITINKATVSITAPVVKNKYKKSAYFKVTVKNKASGKVISGLTVKITVYTGKKYKTYSVKTNSNGVASLNTQSLSKGTHNVVIKVSTSYYYGSKSGNLIVIT